MRRFLITSHAWQGNAELVFDAAGRLVIVDVKDTTMPLPIVRIFKEKAPAHIDEIEAAFKGTHATIVEADFEVSFDMFWKKYDKKINKIRAMKVWEKMPITMMVKAYFGIDAYSRHLKYGESWRSKADPETYLRNQMWENEYK